MLWALTGRRMNLRSVFVRSPPYWIDRRQCADVPSKPAQPAAAPYGSGLLRTILVKDRTEPARGRKKPAVPEALKATSAKKVIKQPTKRGEP
jgi:hypothetical protein